MTVRGDLWVVCMVCTPIRDTFPTKGRRVYSQILLTLALCRLCLVAGRTVCWVQCFVWVSLFLSGFPRRSEMLVLVNMGPALGRGRRGHEVLLASYFFSSLWSASSHIPRNPLCTVYSASFTSCYACLFRSPLHLSRIATPSSSLRPRTCGRPTRLSPSP